MKNIEENNSEKKIKMHQGASPLLYKNARELRERMTEAEIMLWEHLRMKKLDGFKFRRQHPIGIHILDFYCHKKKLGIELDGGYHETKEQEQLDQERTNILGHQNIRIIRFSNEEVLNKVEQVLKEIRQELSK